MADERGPPSKNKKKEGPSKNVYPRGRQRRDERADALARCPNVAFLGVVELSRESDGAVGPWAEVTFKKDAVLKPPRRPRELADRLGEHLKIDIAFHVCHGYLRAGGGGVRGDLKATHHGGEQAASTGGLALTGSNRKGVYAHAADSCEVNASKPREGGVPHALRQRGICVFKCDQNSKLARSCGRAEEAGRNSKERQRMHQRCGVRVALAHDEDVGDTP